MTPLEQLEAAFRRWLYLPDMGALYATLATVAANRLEGDPVWLLLVGPPGGGKSELLGSLTGLQDVHPAATLTEAGLLSGTPKRETAEGAKGGLLRVIGDFGIVVAKDFGSVLSMNRDQRSLLLAALREIYDGSWTRHIGTDGGRTLHWAGKVGFVGGVTPTIDRHHSVMGAMGERFVLYRLPGVDADEQAGRALEHAGREKTMRADLATAVETFLNNLQPAPSPFGQEDTVRLISLATLVVRARSAVERDGYTREVELIPEPEAPTRLVVVLRRLIQGLDAIGLHRDQSWRVITKIGLDSVPALRLSCLQHLHEHGPAQTPTLAATLDYPTQTTRRALEDLAAHGLIIRTIRGEGQRADTWAVSPFADAKIRACVPDLSSSMRRGVEEEDQKPPNGAVSLIDGDTSGTQQPHTATDTTGTQTRFTDGSEQENGIPF